jgi:hypothetical protein
MVSSIKDQKLWYPRLNRIRKRSEKGSKFEKKLYKVLMEIREKTLLSRIDGQKGGVTEVFGGVIWVRRRSIPAATGNSVRTQITLFEAC